MPSPMLAAFQDELQKISASHGMRVISKTRKGSRPISVARLLEKDRDGTLRRKHADSAGAPQDVRGDSVDDPGAAQPHRRKDEGPSAGSMIDTTQKTGSVPGAQSQTSPILSGEDARGVVASKPRMPGDVPTQEVAIDQPQGRIEPRAITFDTSAKRIRRGETPTRTDDMNKVDRADMRDNTTTVTGLGQGSTGIGAFNSPAEHT